LFSVSIFFIIPPFAHAEGIEGGIMKNIAGNNSDLFTAEDEQLITFDNDSNYYWIQDIENFIEENELDEVA
jgi:hypothetical protein